MIKTISELWAELQNDRRQHWLRNGAAEDDISILEGKLGLSLPTCYREFLKYTNGAVLFQTEELLGTKKGWEHDESILEARNRLLSEYQSMPKNYIPFHFSGIWHCFQIDKSKNEVLEWRYNTQEAVTIYDDFIDWVNRYLLPIGHGNI